MVMAEFPTQCVLYSAAHKVIDLWHSIWDITNSSFSADCKPELQMMYAGSKLSLVKEAELTKVFEIRCLEELTEEWLNSKLIK